MITDDKKYYSEKIGKSEQKELEKKESNSLCPKCKTGKIDYDGLLNVVCRQCGYTSAGCFT